MECLKNFALSSVAFDNKRFRMRKSLLKPINTREEEEIEEASEVLRVKEM